MAGYFIGVVRTEWLRGEDGDWTDNRMVLLEPFSFVDPDGKEWIVPAGQMTDGASIPRWLWSLVGGPFEGAYREAAVVHDRYCCTRSESWWRVHRMFYDACVAAGVPDRHAKALYSGVLAGGPRWPDGSPPLPGECPGRAYALAAAADAAPPPAEQAMVDWVLRENPGLAKIHEYVDRLTAPVE